MIYRERFAKASVCQAVSRSGTNGKVERSRRIDDQEYYQFLDKDCSTDYLFNEKLREWEDYYNYHRPLEPSRAKRRANDTWRK